MWAGRQIKDKYTGDIYVILPEPVYAHSFSAALLNERKTITDYKIVISKSSLRENYIDITSGIAKILYG